MLGLIRMEFYLLSELNDFNFSIENYTNKRLDLWMSQHEIKSLKYIFFYFVDLTRTQMKLMVKFSLVGVTMSSQ